MTKRKIATPKLQNAINAADSQAEAKKNLLITWNSETRPAPELGDPPFFGLNTDLGEGGTMEYWNGSGYKTSQSGGGGDINEPGGNNLLIL